jgi:TolB-like protein
MNIKIPFILSLLLAGAMAHAAAPQSALTVAVYNFKGDDDAESLGSKVTALVTAELTSETNMALVERAELKQALNEQAFGVSGMVNSDAASTIGQITGAKVLVTGEVIKTGDGHLVIVATLIGTETGRLYADKVEGAADNLMSLTSNLSRKIAQTVNEQAANLTMAAQESSAERLERIVKSINGTNRPSVSVKILLKNGFAGRTLGGEFGIILLKAGFKVVDENSERKPDMEITGIDDTSAGPRHGDLYSFRAVVELKVVDRRTGNIITFDRQETTATAATRVGANRSAEADAVDALAERVLPLLAK